MLFINKGAKIGLGACIVSMAFCAVLFLTSDNSEIITIKNDKGKWDIEKFYTEYIESIHENQDSEEEDPPKPPKDKYVEDPNLTSKEVYDILVKDPDFKSKALALSAVYKELKDTYGYNGALGVMANVFHEGNLGLVQYGKTVANWNGEGTSASSSASSPLIVSSMNNVKAVRGLGVSGNTVGVGIVQWTYYTYMSPLADCYQKHCAAGFNDNTLIKAEMEMLSSHAAKFASSLKQSTPEDATERWLIDYERPKNAESKKTLRRGTATKLDSLLKGVK